MILVCPEECANGNIHVQRKENGPRFYNGKGTSNNIMSTGNVKEHFYVNQVVVYLLRIRIIEDFSASCVRVIYLEFKVIRPNVHGMARLECSLN